jgi:hypothetical protein
VVLNLSGDPAVNGPPNTWSSISLPPAEFCLRSLARSYGLIFLGQVILRHPLRTIRGLLDYRRLYRESTQEEGITRLFVDPEEHLAARLTQERASLLVAVGFCQKPLAPPCPAGRANHDCRYFDDLDLPGEPGELDPACAICEVRKTGLLALEAGASMHVMTSALDIARDVLIPSVGRRRFSSVIMCLCPYSVQAIALPLIICGLPGYLFPYASGSCANWEQWLRADEGFKDEMTMLGPRTREKMSSLLRAIGEVRREEGLEYLRFQRRGNVYVPIASEG